MQEKLPLEPTETAQILAAGYALSDSKLFDINDTPAVLVPDGYRVQIYPDLRESPVRIEQEIRAATAAAFVGYINRFARRSTLVFANPADASFLAILDYQDSTLLPDWCRHRVTYTCPHSKEWETWSKNSGVIWTQAKFAEFIEDNLPDIIEPASAEMLEIARTLDARTNVRFKSGIRLDNGETQFIIYEEVIEGAAGAKGQLKIPQTIKLALRVFQGEDPYAVEARFKYRIKDGGLLMWYELVRPHRVIEDSFNGILARLREQLGETPVLEAVPE